MSDWMPFLDPYGVEPDNPRRHVWIDIQRPDDGGHAGTISTVRYSDMHPMMNVAGLYWRPSKFDSAAPMIELTATEEKG